MRDFEKLNGVERNNFPVKNEGEKNKEFKKIHVDPFIFIYEQLLDTLNKIFNNPNHEKNFNYYPFH